MTINYDPLTKEEFDILILIKSLPGDRQAQEQELAKRGQAFKSDTIPHILMGKGFIDNSSIMAPCLDTKHIPARPYKLTPLAHAYLATRNM